MSLALLGCTLLLVAAVTAARYHRLQRVHRSSWPPPPAPRPLVAAGGPYREEPRPSLGAGEAPLALRLGAILSLTVGALAIAWGVLVAALLVGMMTHDGAPPTTVTTFGALADEAAEVVRRLCMRDRDAAVTAVLLLVGLAAMCGLAVATARELLADTAPSLLARGASHRQAIRRAITCLFGFGGASLVVMDALCTQSGGAIDPLAVPSLIMLAPPVASLLAALLLLYVQPRSLGRACP